MKKLIIFSLFLFVINLESASNSAVTYLSPRGRLGDQLFCYCKAKWIAYKYSLRLYYKAFEYADKFCLSQIDKLYGDEVFKSCDGFCLKRVNGYAVDTLEQDVDKFKYLDLNFNDESTLYVVDESFFAEEWKYLVFDYSNIIHPYDIFYNESYIEQGKNKYQFRYDETIMIFKQDLAFTEELRKVIRPLQKIKTIERPKDVISVAVHVRIGGGFDGPTVSPFFYESNPQLGRYTDFIEGRSNSLVYESQCQMRDKLVTKIPLTLAQLKNRETESDIARPLKHPPMQFYVDQIKGLSAMLKDVPLFVLIFTDQPDPCEIKNEFEKLVNKRNITFACRQEENGHNLNVLEDLFSMSEFDCLIRPYSSFSQIAQLIGNHKIVITPYHGIWHEGNLIIDEVKIYMGT